MIPTCAWKPYASLAPGSYEEVPDILGLLADEDEAVRDAALGALVEMRERSAVKALAESRPMRDVREMRKVLDAIATLGGREAMDYLAFVAETHDEEDIRAMAKEALERLKRRSETLSPTK
jgi:HEAT repeat protein